MLIAYIHCGPTSFLQMLNCFVCCGTLKFKHSLICLMQPKSRVSPPTSPSSSDEVAIARKLAEAQERKQSLEQEKAKRLADHLEKISLAKEKKEKEHEKFSAKVLEVNRLSSLLNV